MSMPTATSLANDVEADNDANSILYSICPPGRRPSFYPTTSVHVDSNGNQRRRSPSQDTVPDSPVVGRPSITAPTSAPNDIETVDRSLDGDRKETTQLQGADATSAPAGLESPTVSTNASPDPRPNDPSEEKQAPNIPPHDGQIGGFSPLPQQLTGWAAVEKTLTDFDKQEIGGYKEDIDSLLTFTGLYSAVLTAFVIVSFPQLQEDTAGESLKVLRFIANQTSGGTALGGQLANATVPTLADPPPFQPTVTAIRVNVLWFASLAISLSTASFAILVKQWLREYMAFSSSSPQGQMRVRHLRRSGLEDWYVLGIASMLPLLLQISLALFFIGLCFFTADIHPTIGHTTIILVCAWAFFSVVVTLSPIFSVRCPYKTPALAPITTALRTHVYAQIPLLTSILLFVILALPAILIYGPVYLIVKAGKAIGVETWRWDWHDLSEHFFDGIVYPLESIMMIDRFATKFEAKIWDEKEASREKAKDLKILASADIIQDNPEIDEATIAAALDQIQPHWTDATELLVTLIGNRVPIPTFAEGPENTTIDLTALSLKTRGAIQHLFLDHVASRLETSNSNIEPSHLYQSGAWGSFISSTVRSNPGSDLVLLKESIWKHFHNFLLVQLKGYPDYGTGLQLLWCTCAYLVRTKTHHSSEGDLREDMDLLQQAIELSEQKSTTLSCDSSVSNKLGSLAKRTAYRLMESADNLRPPHPNWSTSTLYYDAVLLALKLCGIVYLAGHRIDCEKLLGVRLRSLVSLRTQAAEGHEEMIILCMSLPSGYVCRSLDFGLMDGRKYQEDDRISISNAIKAIARDTIAQDVTTVQILNSSLIALSMGYREARQWLKLPPSDGIEKSYDRLQMFNLLASALAKARKLNKKNAIRANGHEDRDLVGYCWSRISYEFMTAVRVYGDLERLDLASFQYLSYLVLELSLLLAHNRTGDLSDFQKNLFQKMQSMSAAEKSGIRERGERDIGRGASRQEESTPANRGILRSIQDVIRGQARRLSDGPA